MRTLLLALALLTATPAMAAPPPAPAPAVAHDDDFPWGALVPLGFTAGYLYEGRLDRVLLGGLGIYALAGAGLVIGWGLAVDNLTWKDPLGSAMGLVLSPIGGVLFTLEVILLDFSIRTFTPVVLASVIANVATQAIYERVLREKTYQAIFQLPDFFSTDFPHNTTFGRVVAFALLGVACGVVGAALTRTMYAAEHRFARLKLPRTLKPAIGGALLAFFEVSTAKMRVFRVPDFLGAALMLGLLGVLLLFVSRSL